MAKLIIVLFLLLILAGVVFYFGWIQILIPPGTYAVVHTKTSGFEDQPIPSGVFAWRAERLIPTNLTVYVFDIQPFSVRTPAISGTLPSGETYGSALQESPDFQYSVGLSVTFSMKPSSLPVLVAEESLRPDSLKQWYQDRADAVASAVARIVLESPSELYQSDFYDTLREDLASRDAFSHIEIQRITPLEVRLPDDELYQEAKRQYMSLARARESRDVEAISREQTNLKALREYGELFNEYPVLIKYLYVMSLQGKELDILDMDLSPISEESE